MAPIAGSDVGDRGVLTLTAMGVRRSRRRSRGPPLRDPLVVVAFSLTPSPTKRIRGVGVCHRGTEVPAHAAVGLESGAILQQLNVVWYRGRRSGKEVKKGVTRGWPPLT